MNKRNWIILLAGFSLLAGCSDSADKAMHDAKDPAAQISKSMQAHDGKKYMATTSSDVARKHYMAGYEAYEMARFNDAKGHFTKAIAADPGFASAHLMQALVATSTKGFSDSLARAGSLSANASPGEKLLIEAQIKANDGDQAGALAAMKKLTAMHPESAPALMFEAQVHTNLNDTAATLATLNKAIKLDPTLSAAHMQLGNAYMFMEPKNFDKAEAHFMKSVALSPKEANPYDLLGDVHRAQGNMKAAYADYTKAAELAPTMGSPLQQRGHVNSFLGKYDEARADYSRAAALEDARGTNNGGFFMVYHAIVNVHEGKTDAAIAELKALAAKADSMDDDAKLDLKINALFNAMMIATNSSDVEQAGSLTAEVASLLRQQGKELGGAEQIAAREATIAYREGLLAARMGDMAAVKARAKDFERHVANNTNPRKLNRMHRLLGMSDFYNEDYAGAAKHFAEGDVVNDVYIKYHQAIAHERNGNSKEANRMFKELATWNFNDANYAMIRSDVLARAAKS